MLDQPMLIDRIERKIGGIKGNTMLPLPVPLNSSG